MNDNQNQTLYDNRLWVRSKPVKAVFHAAEFADLETIPEGWGVPLAKLACDRGD